MVRKTTMCQITILRKILAQSHRKKMIMINIGQILALPNTVNTANSSNSSIRAIHIIPHMASKTGTVFQVDKLLVILEALSPTHIMDMMTQIKAAETTTCGEIANDEFELYYDTSTLTRSHGRPSGIGRDGTPTAFILLVLGRDDRPIYCFCIIRKFFLIFFSTT